MMLFPEPDCRLCGLSEGRTMIVLPDGDASSPVVFVGEAPGEKEDETGRPFVGRSGMILERMMEEEGLPRSKVLITNTVKCRPPGNRDPRPDEMAACLPFLMSEIGGRELVVGLGRSACRDLMRKEVKMRESANIPTTIDVSGRTLEFIPTYHPAATIYSREARGGLRLCIRYVKDRFFNP